MSVPMHATSAAKYLQGGATDPSNNPSSSSNNTGTTVIVGSPAGIINNTALVTTSSSSSSAIVNMPLLASTATTGGGSPADVDSAKKATVTASRESSLPFGQSAALALTYMFGCITWFLLIRYSKIQEKIHGEKYYDNAAAVFYTELFKWLFSIGMMFYRTGRFLPVSVWRTGSWRLGLYYAVPSGIYALYNNLTYYNLTSFDPGTYQVFMQTRVLFTGVLYTWILSRALSSRKWASLTMLTFGVAAKYFTWDLKIDYRITFMLFQASLSAFAGVANEFLLKDQASMDVNEQNFFMYSFALIFNFSWGMYSNSTGFLRSTELSHLNWLFFFIVMNGALIGVVTSLILKFINVIVKAFASACEILLTAVVAAILLGDPLSIRDVVACCIVMYSIYVYYTTGPYCPGGYCNLDGNAAPLEGGSGGDGNSTGKR